MKIELSMLEWPSRQCLRHKENQTNLVLQKESAGTAKKEDITLRTVEKKVEERMVKHWHGIRSTGPQLSKLMNLICIYSQWHDPSYNHTFRLDCWFRIINTHHSKQIELHYIEDPSEIDGVIPGATLQTCGWGTVTIQFNVNDKIYTVQLCDMKYAPEAPITLSQRLWTMHQFSSGTTSYI